ncbi:MAG: hypothetical protein AB7G93_21020 [Bdellovibrionales bacterium]
MKSWWTLYLTLPWDRKLLWTAVLLALIPVLVSFIKERTSVPAPAHEDAAALQVDTHIPRGFVLVPIEVQNYEALDSILGRFGIVDLLQAGFGEGQSQRLVARNVRILRAPQNPSHFAVLIQESEAQGLLAHGGAFTVVVKRPDQAGTEFVKAPGKDRAQRKRKIVYEGD